MSTAYLAGEWSIFGEAVAKAAAAQAGLLFIAVSINLRQILEIPACRARQR